MLVMGLVMRKQHRYITCSIFSLMLVSFQISQQFIIKVPCNFLRMFPLLNPQESRCGSIHGVGMCLSLLLSLLCPYRSKPTTHLSYFPFNRMISLNTQSFHWKLVLYIFFNGSFSVYFSNILKMVYLNVYQGSSHPSPSS